MVVGEVLLIAEPVTARMCAQDWGVGEAHARRILAPVEPVGRHPDTGAMFYDPAAAAAARAAGPGRGRRTDLTGRPVQHGVAGYRAGCPCTVCRTGRAELAAKERHTARYGPDGPVNAAVRRRVLEHVKRGCTVQDAAARVGLTHQAIYGAARALPAFGAQLDAAIRPLGN